MSEYRIMVVAGEPSGDLHASRLLQQLNRRDNQFHCYGIGGERMRQYGFKTIVGIEQMAVMGLIEILRHFPYLFGVLRKMRALLKTDPPDLLILVDYPGFNMLLAKRAKKLGIKVLYYISPKIWVWRAGRVHKIAKRVDRMALIFPFEIPYYERVGVAATYVGHPLVGQVNSDDSVEEARLRIGVDQDKKTIGLFPGSRRGEVQQLLPDLLQSAREIYAKNDNIQFVISQAPELSSSLFAEAERFDGAPLTIIKGDVHTVIRSCDAIATASGTVTLEMALLETPMVVIYRVSPVSYWLLRHLIKTEYISLVNIVAEHEVVPELLQENASAHFIVPYLLSILNDGDDRSRMISGLRDVKSRLGSGDSAERLADLVEEMLYE